MKIKRASVMTCKSLPMIAVIFLLLASCSCHQEDDLDKIKAFRPEDKYFKSALVSLHFVMETSSADEIDTLFNQLIELYDLPVDAGSVQDGVYTGESPYDAFDYKHVVRIRVENGKFTEVDYNEVNKDGQGKQEDEAYCEEMSVTGTTPALAYPAMEEQLLNTQHILHVDGLSGATYSRYRFRYAVGIALMKAQI